MRWLIYLGFVASAACGQSQYEGAADAPPGGVSFGGGQDIGQLRAILDRGDVPGAEVLDANGFFNEHYNAPSPASCGTVLCVTPGMSVGRDWLTGAHQATLQLSVSTSVNPEDYARLPMQLVVVVDHSGSMASDGRLTKVKQGLHTLIDGLLDEDRLAIVEFDDEVDTVAPFASTLDRVRLHKVVDGLQPRGGTNIHDGLAQGFGLLGDRPANERQNRVILLSDGLATAGNTSQDAMFALAREHVSSGVALSTIGVGNDFDVALMRGLAEQGAGSYYFLEDPAAADEVFEEELDYFLQPIALDVRLEAVAQPGFELGEVTGSTLWTAQPGAGAMTIPAVFVASRTSQTGGQGRRGGGSMIFAHLTPSAGSTGKVAQVTLSFRLPGTQERQTQSIALDYGSDASKSPEQPYLSSPELAERFGMYNTFLGLRAAMRSTDPRCALAILGATATAAGAWNAQHEDPDIAADLALLAQYSSNIREHNPGLEPAPIATCPAAMQPYDAVNYEEPYPVDDIRYQEYACSAGSPSGLAPLALALLALRRRRRA